MEHYLDIATIRYLKKLVSESLDGKVDEWNGSNLILGSLHDLCEGIVWHGHFVTHSNDP